MTNDIKLPKKVAPFIFMFVKKQWQLFLLINISATVAMLATNTIWPSITGDLIDIFNNLDQNPGKSISMLYKPLLLALLFWVFVETMQRCKGFAMAYTKPKFESNIRMSVFQYTSRHSHNYFMQKYIGAIAHRIDDLPRGASLIVDDILTIFIPLLISILSSSAIMFTMHMTLSTTFTVWILSYIAVVLVFCKFAVYYSSIQSAARAQLQGSIVDSVRNHFSVKIFNAFKHEARNTLTIQDDEVCKYRYSMKFIEKSKVILSILNTVGIAILFLLAVKLWIEGEITVGDLVFIANTTLSILVSLSFAADEISYVFTELGIFSRNLRVIQDDSRMPSTKKFPKLEVKDGKIEFINVTFKYHKQSDLFVNKSLTIKPKQRVGLVGLSGSGKSTFTHLIMRLFDVDSGIIKIDDKDITKVQLESLRKNITLIQQEPILFHRTIMENIKYGKLDVTDDEIKEAAIKAHCHEFIERMPDMYDAIVGETGSKLSGGQRQRIAIARAILKNAPILIMDEATSALDTVTEEKIQESMKYLMGGKTVLIIAHRLSTLKRVDRLLVFENGVIVEDGKHEDLVRIQNGYYKKLWSMQHDGLLPEGKL